LSFQQKKKIHLNVGRYLFFIAIFQNFGIVDKFCFVKRKTFIERRKTIPNLITHVSYKNTLKHQTFSINFVEKIKEITVVTKPGHLLEYPTNTFF
jgi:hypothetical protein